MGVPLLTQVSAVLLICKFLECGDLSPLGLPRLVAAYGSDSQCVVKDEGLKQFLLTVIAILPQRRDESRRGKRGQVRALQNRAKSY